MNETLNQIFKGFIITNGKIPKKKYTDPENQFTYEEVQSHRSFGGVLSKDAILVDLDDDLEGELLLNIIKAKGVKCRVHRTDSGLHAFFIGHHVAETKTKIGCAIGLNTDYKLGLKNGIAILKLDGRKRELVYETEEIGPLPGWLYPISKEIPDFLQMGDGDGRNDALYRYILTLQGSGLTKDEVRETIEIINQFILKEPLGSRELETILRDEAFPSESFYDNKGRFQFRKFEEHFSREVHAVCLDSQLHIYKDGVYIKGEKNIRGEMLEFIPDLSTAHRNEILHRMEDRIRVEGERASPNLIAFRNGIYDMKENVLTEHNPEHIITNLIDWNYNPNAYSEVADKMLTKLACGDAMMRALLEEIIGSCFYRENSLAGGKAFILLGDASNGKSTYLFLLTHILGRSNVSNIPLQDLPQRFKTSTLLNKLANICADISKKWVPDPMLYKNIVTGDRISAEFKGGNEFEYEPYPKMIFSANNMPRIEDETGAVLRRTIPVPFNAKFSPDDPDYDPFIKRKLMTEESIEYLIKVGIEGLKRVLSTNKYSVTDAIEKELKTINEFNNPIVGFIEEELGGRDRILDRTTKEVYDRYCDFCIESGLQPKALNSFVKQINKHLDTVATRKMINGHTMKIFEIKK